MSVFRRVFGRPPRRYPCPCCGQLTLEEPPPGTYDICAECWWEDDPVQFDDPTYRGGANEESLEEARAAYRARADERSSR